MSRPRFIAGAVCPNCGAMDRLQVFGGNERQQRRCVSCGHEDSLDSAASQQPKTRLAGGLKRPAEESTASPVRILDPGKVSPGGTEEARQRPPEIAAQPDEDEREPGGS